MMRKRSHSVIKVKSFRNTLTDTELQTHRQFATRMKIRKRFCNILLTSLHYILYTFRHTTI